MSDLERDIREALERGQADELGKQRPTRYRREPDPLPDTPTWGPVDFLRPATPMHLLGLGAMLWLLGQLFRRAPIAEPLVLVGLVLVAIAILSLVLLPHGVQPKRWRGRLITVDESWRARLYRWLYKR